MLVAVAASETQLAYVNGSASTMLSPLEVEHLCLRIAEFDCIRP
jgi:hypothetical protein